jgi:hypothetical protein
MLDGKHAESEAERRTSNIYAGRLEDGSYCAREHELCLDKNQENLIARKKW